MKQYTPLKRSFKKLSGIDVWYMLYALWSFCSTLNSWIGEFVVSFMMSTVFPRIVSALEWFRHYQLHCENVCFIKMNTLYLVVTYYNVYPLKLIFEILSFLKMCPIFDVSVDNFFLVWWLFSQDAYISFVVSCAAFSEILERYRE